MYTREQEKQNPNLTHSRPHHHLLECSCSRYRYPRIDNYTRALQYNIDSMLLQYCNIVNMAIAATGIAIRTVVLEYTRVLQHGIAIHCVLRVHVYPEYVQYTCTVRIAIYMAYSSIHIAIYIPWQTAVLEYRYRYQHCNIE